MKKQLSFLFTSVLFIVNATGFAQGVSRKHIPENREALRQWPGSVRINPPQQQPALQLLQNTNYLPLNEVDSTYDPYNKIWQLTVASTHSYYQSNCLDSVITSYSAADTVRGTYAYDSKNNNTYYLSEQWDGVQWVNQWLNEQEVFPNSCFLDHQYLLTWTSTIWDTTAGSKTVVANFNSHGDPTLIVQKRISYGTWLNDYRYIFTYDGSDKMLAGEQDVWNSSSGQFEPSDLETSYVFNDYTDYCSYNMHSYEHQIWNGSSWQKQDKYIYSPYAFGTNDTTYFLEWNGASYDTSHFDVAIHDSYGNALGDIHYYYDNQLHEFYLQYFSVDSATYGAHNEIVRKENYSNYFYYSDSIVPHSVTLYSNFVPCTATTGIHESSSSTGFTVSPNPFISTCLLHFDEALKDAQLVLYDLPGKEVMRKTVKGQDIELPRGNLPPGLYFIRVSDEKKQYIEKIIVR